MEGLNYYILVVAVFPGGEKEMVISEIFSRERGLKAWPDQRNPRASVITGEFVFKNTFTDA